MRHGDGQEIKGRSGGSGAIISEAGFVVTNHHVIEEGSEFVCTLADQRRVEARLVGSDPLADLAVLQLQLDQLPEGLQIRRQIPFEATGITTGHLGAEDTEIAGPMNRPVESCPKRGGTDVPSTRSRCW